MKLLIRRSSRFERRPMGDIVRKGVRSSGLIRSQDPVSRRGPVIALFPQSRGSTPQCPSPPRCLNGYYWNTIRGVALECTRTPSGREQEWSQLLNATETGTSFWVELFKAGLKYHGNLQLLVSLNLRSALTQLLTSRPSRLDHNGLCASSRNVTHNFWCCCCFFTVGSCSFDPVKKELVWDVSVLIVSSSMVDLVSWEGGDSFIDRLYFVLVTQVTPPPSSPRSVPVHFTYFSIENDLWNEILKTKREIYSFSLLLQMNLFFSLKKSCDG